MTEPAQELTLADLSLLKSILDLACERGAFRGPELKTVGDAYERLSAFIVWAVSTQNQELSQGDKHD